MVYNIISFVVHSFTSNYKICIVVYFKSKQLKFFIDDMRLVALVHEELSLVFNSSGALSSISNF